MQGAGPSGAAALRRLQRQCHVATVARIDPRQVALLARKGLPRPVDVLNLIDLEDERSYARYGLAVTPAMLLAGARLQWMGRHERTVLGAPQGERLLIVRYPSHRRFLAMTLNPYYFAINGWRERGVRRFQAAFTDPHVRPAGLSAERRLVFAHFTAPATLGEVAAAVEPHAGPLVYAARQVASASYLRGSRPTDPNPLTLEQVAAFACDGEPPLGEVRTGLPASTVSIQIYRRSSPRALLTHAVTDATKEETA